MTKPTWGWWVGSNEEWYSTGPLASRDDAIAGGKAEYPGETFCIVEALPQSLSFSAENLIDAQYFEADDLFSYEDGNDPDRKGKPEVIKEANAELQALLDQWCDKWRHTFVTPSLFAATRNGETISGSDVVDTDAKPPTAD